MKPPIPIIVAIGLSLAGHALTGHAATEPHPLEPNAPRTVTVSEADTPPVIRAGLLQSTLILLPAEEKVANVFAGDTVDWVFDGGHVASRFISIKPKLANSTTDIHIVSDHGNEYTLAASGGLRRRRSPLRFQSLHRARRQGRQRQAGRAARLCARRRAGQGETGSSSSQGCAGRRAEGRSRPKPKQYRSQYPGTLHFDYTWDKTKGKELGLQQIWRDDKFTYLRGQFQETPALYEVKDKKPRSSTSISTTASTPCRRSWTTGISPSASRRLSSIAPRKARVAMPEPNQNIARYRSRAAGGEAAVRKSMPVVIALVVIIGLIGIANISSLLSGNKKAAPQSALPMRPAAPNAQQVSSFETQQQLQAQRDAEEQQRQQELPPRCSSFRQRRICRGRRPRARRR